MNVHQCSTIQAVNNMSETEQAEPTADEQPKRKIAKKVVTPKHQYFFPHHGRSVLATDIREAETKLKDLISPKRKRSAKAADKTSPSRPAAAAATPPAKTPAGEQPNDVEAGDD
jgi:hypothetical protein